ncbi:MAG: 3-hydroxyacyl-ACP dehydratase FabZ [Cyanobacteria bacterium]|nr:3-hydroxyacyl-ACP dehydratase FabZ [Cyanobacteriota bacterium]
MVFMSSVETMEAPVSDIILPPLSTEEIMQYIPHRYPFLLIDRVTEHVKGKYIVGYKNVTMNEPFFQGHFPGRPIMPGVLQIEALAQLGGVLIAHMENAQGKLAVFAGIDNVRFRRMVVPGDRLDLRADLTKYRLPIGKSECRATVNGELVLEADLMFSLVDHPL